MMGIDYNCDSIADIVRQNGTLQLADSDALLLSFQGWRQVLAWIDYRSMRFVKCEEDWQIEFALVCNGNSPFLQR